jgi:HEPN domain-containing protein
MLLRPEIYVLWEEALKYSGNAEKLSKEGKLQEAANEATWAVVLGCKAATELSKKVEMHDLSVIVNSIFSDLCERNHELWERNEVGKHYTPKETFEWADRALKQLYAAIPPDILRPLR